MPLTPERKVKNKVTQILKDYGVYYFYPMSGGFGKAGVPDIVCCANGRFVAFECKAGGGHTTNLQQLNLEQIRNNGGIALVINEHNIADVDRAIHLCLAHPTVPMTMTTSSSS